MELILPAPKTDPFQMESTFTIAASRDFGCPVRAVRLLLATDDYRPIFSPLFCVGQRQQLAFTREYMVKSLQQLGTRAGL